MTAPPTHRRATAFRLVAMIVGIFLANAGTGLSMAANIEKLVMPGRVISGHAEFEGDCGACHDAESDEARPLLCVACHEGIGGDRTDGTGFHGLFEAARRSDCNVCHTEHKGRDADIVELDAGLFNHEMTDFPLQGAHVSAACKDCHAPGAPMRDAALACGACHQDADVHERQLGAACGTCHSQSAWRDAIFDHSLTGYALTGAHDQVACGDCHQRNRFDQATPACASCHAVDDVHAGERGTDCGSCHTTDTWAGAGFDHARVTGFALEDGHAKLECADCHTRTDHRDDFAAGCESCHGPDDAHQGRLGTDCASCHDAASWTSRRFDHAGTGFALEQAHAALNCTACHKTGVQDAPAASCNSCHALDDVHQAQLTGECSACHSQASWAESVRFDHDMTEFPLLGVHAAVACAGCHSDRVFRGAPEDCASCHADDDPHSGTLGEDCGACHSSNSWAASAFDHGTATAFPLDGAHAGLSCNACHADSGAGSAGAVPATCGGCHRSDDVHDGEFGAGCDNCHSTSSFSVITDL